MHECQQKAKKSEILRLKEENLKLKSRREKFKKNYKN